MASKPSSSFSSRTLGSTSSPEYLTIRECYPHLVSIVKDSYDTIGDRLFSKGYVSSKIRNFIRMDSKMPTEKAQKLLDTIIDRIMYYPNVFDGLIEILEKEGPSTSDLVRELHDVYKAKSGYVVEAPPDHNTKEGDCDSKGSHSVDSSSEDSFHPATELDESLLVQQVTLVRNDITTPSSKEDKAANKRNRRVLDDIGTRKVAGFVCPFCKKCTVETFFSKAGCPKAVSCVTEQQAVFPYLDTQMLSEQNREELEANLVHDTRKMIFLFADTQDSIASSLNSRNLTMKQVVNYVLSLGMFVADIGSKSLAKDDEADLRQADSIFDIFSVLRSYVSFFNYEILERLAIKFGSPEDTRSVEEYVDAFNHFCERSVFECPPNVFRYAIQNDDDRVFSVKYITEATPILGDVVSVRRKIAEILGIKVWALQLCSIEEGCVCLRFWMPSHIADEVLPVLESQQAALSDIGVRILELVEDTSTAEGQSEKPRLSQANRSTLLHPSLQPSVSSLKGNPPLPSSPSLEGVSRILLSSQEGKLQQLSLEGQFVPSTQCPLSIDEQLTMDGDNDNECSSKLEEAGISSPTLCLGESSLELISEVLTQQSHTGIENQKLEESQPLSSLTTNRRNDFPQTNREVQLKATVEKELPKFIHSDTDFELYAERNDSDKINSDSQTMGGCGGAESWIISLEIKTEDSKIDKDISTQHSKDSCIKLDSVEQDSPYPRKDRRPSLGKSASIEVCPSCRNPLKRMPRRSSTESSLSEATIKVAIEKLESQGSELGEDAEVILRRCVRQHAADFRNYTDFTMLAIHLFVENLVHSGEMEYLNSPYHTQVQKANRFYFEIMDRKGPEAYRSFYYALKAEKKHKGHEDLLKKLEQALDELR